ncbi:MAG: DUF4116 domain-containing protein [Parachlamydiaceae bacterium]|nr:DUF4116 domain-containing protein [Parachlamydiaceae bacterium]
MTAIIKYFWPIKNIPTDTPKSKSIHFLPYRVIYKIISFCDTNVREELLLCNNLMNYQVIIKSEKETYRLFRTINLIANQCLKIDLTDQLVRIYQQRDIHHCAWDKKYREMEICARLYPFLKNEFDNDPDFRDNPTVLMLMFKGMERANQKLTSKDLSLSERLQKDEKFILDVARVYRGAILLATKELQLNRDFVMKMVKQNSLTLIRCQHFADDNEVVLEAVRGNGLSLIAASERLKGDQKVVVNAIDQNGMALQFAKKFQDDVHIVCLALKTNVNALRFASKHLQTIIPMLVNSENDKNNNPNTTQSIPATRAGACILS